jgi:Tol biopolymer transport system component
VPLSDFIYYGLAISPNGKFVYYSRGQGSSQQQPDIYRESIFGGVPQRVVSEAQGWFSLSPDGNKISFVRCPYTDQEYCSLWIADSIDGGNERKLVSRPRPFRIADNQISPDGKTIAFAVGESRTYSNDFGLSKVDIDSTAERGLTSEKFFNIEHLAWLPDEQGLLLTARQEPDKNFRIWHVSAATGTASRLTDDSQTYSALSLNDDGSILVTSQVAADFHLNLYRSSSPTSGPKRLANATTVNFAPNGELVFSSARTGNPEIWSIKSDGSGERQLTNNPSDDLDPIVSPNSGLIFFASNRTGKIQIWKMNPDGSNQTQVTFQEGGSPSLVSPDGHWLYYKSALEKKFMRVSIPDGHKEMVFDRSSQDSVLAPSGNRVALSERINGEDVLNVVSLPDGAVARTYRYADPMATLVCLGWSHDEKYLAYILADKSGLEQTLWFQPLDGQRPRKVVDLHEEVFEASGLALSPDDESFAVVQGTWSHDAVLIRGLK